VTAWAEIETELPAVLATITGIPVGAITWRPLLDGWMPDVHIRLQVLGGIRAIGRDEVRTEYTLATDTNAERVYGGRALPISIRVESMDQSLASAAYATAETIRAALRRTDILTTLRTTAGLGLSRMEAIRLEDYTDDEGRLRSLAILDVIFLAHIAEAGEDVGYIRIVNATGTYTDPAGAPAADSPRVIQVVLD
jgi:hypothetical protein